MPSFLFVPGVLQLLSRGAFFRTLFYFFRVAAVLSALVGLVLCAGLLKTVVNLPAIGVIGGFVFVALVVVAFYAVAHIYWSRADDIRELPAAKFATIPIYSILVRTLGEVLSAFVVVMSVGGFVLFLLVPQQAGGMLSEILPMGPLSMMLGRGGNSFVEALVVLVGGCIYAVLLLAGAYLIAEFIAAIAEIAISTALTAANTALPSTAMGSSPVSAAVAAIPLVQPTSAQAVCRSCEASNPPGAVFCENCGKQI